ncbi:MAG: digeranylgeranylglycerophospholipid reductase [Thermoproteus sp. AZ2]|jgi:geranylgeranyl reductase family protein|uniref:Digeranylgeranylglycerophospholipid reductase n=1 Tax=Thermoproteus sp. AZ2 TaxID=1609232 RepID=A0ACC6V231_9CREN
MEHYDVVVVGAGTAGAYTAYNLAKLGFKTALLESKYGEMVGVKTCGDALGKHHVDRMARYLTPNPNIFVNDIKGVELFSPDLRTKYVIKGEGYMLDRFNWGKWLVREAVNAGAAFYEGTTATAPIIEGGSVVGVRANDARQGTAKEFRAKVVVDASGSVGVVRTKLPDTWPISERLHPEDVSHAYREVFYIDGSVEAPNYIKIYLDQQISPGGYWWAFPYSEGFLNVGLGVWGILKINPRANYVKYLEPRYKIRNKVHMGGGFIPTRRPLKSLVGNGILAVGDAAAAVNPLHGGGIGQALLTGELASKAIKRAFEIGKFDVETLWQYNLDYMREWGYRQAQLDVVRLMLQTLDNDDLNFGLSRKLLTEEDVLDISSHGVTLSVVDKMRLALQFVGRPGLLMKLYNAMQYAKRIGDLYLQYPQSPSGLSRWHEQVMEAYREFREKIGLGPMPA